MEDCGRNSGAALRDASEELEKSCYIILIHDTFTNLL